MYLFFLVNILGTTNIKENEKRKIVSNSSSKERERERERERETPKENTEN